MSKTNLTVEIDKDLKHKAKIKALLAKMTLKEYVAYLIKKDIEGGE